MCGAAVPGMGQADEGRKGPTERDVPPQVHLRGAALACSCVWVHLFATSHAQLGGVHVGLHVTSFSVSNGCLNGLRPPF